MRFVNGAAWSSFSTGFIHLYVNWVKKSLWLQQKVKANHQLTAFDADFVLWVWRFPPTTSGWLAKAVVVFVSFRLSADCLRARDLHKHLTKDARRWPHGVNEFACEMMTGRWCLTRHNWNIQKTFLMILMLFSLIPSIWL